MNVYLYCRARLSLLYVDETIWLENSAFSPACSLFQLAINLCFFLLYVTPRPVGHCSSTIATFFSFYVCVWICCPICTVPSLIIIIPTLLLLRYNTFTATLILLTITNKNNIRWSTDINSTVLFSSLYHYFFFLITYYQRCIRCCLDILLRE